ncbi:DUF2875 family protein [Herbaspirillum sp. RTI4]|uniref:type VI lipase adapter Tla3 domain-containing protein n=1 Tax=Herbaspirillum sp. RTI4 TaxID=3048640 RepID=UPI002AB41ECB|nr:DUF2875 family protein [Herbaspirillum sp. RTI4]MDY7578174.1 DUF2875 family protein [Herbaspirillum sp. RTI4]MEA9980763.1 DUF2875 family protein [Herbaspirillum sp. RTI4]
MKKHLPFRRKSCAILAGMALMTFAHAQSPLPSENTRTTMKKPAAEKAPLIDSLEIVGVGVSLETWRNHPYYPDNNLWNAVEQSNGRYIISQDPLQYPKDFRALQMMGAKRREDTVEAAMREFMDRYPLPISVVGPWDPEAHDAKGSETVREANADSFVVTKDDAHYKERGEFAGLLFQSGQVINSYLHDNPDKLFNTVFKTFDHYGDLPAMGIASKDGMIERVAHWYYTDKPTFEKMIDPAYHPKQSRIYSDSMTFLTLVRRGRIDWLRSFAPLVKDTMVLKIFSKGDTPARNWSEFAGWKRPPPQPFVPTPYIATPWTEFQIDQFDHLENRGTLHRPQVISYLDEHRKPVKAAERQSRTEAALRAALAPLGGKMPARIFYDYGSVWEDRTSYTRYLPFVQSVHNIDEEFDLFDRKKSFDLAQILGDTGAGSPFVAVALASMAAMQSGGATLIANLRRNDGATFILVTPPSAEQVKKDADIDRPFWPREKMYPVKIENRY